MVEEATRIDPLSLFVSATKTAILLMLRRLAEAEAECRRALELDSEFWRAVVGAGPLLRSTGLYDRAIECYERATILSDRVPTSIGALGRAYALAGRRKEAYGLLAELDQLALRRYVSPYAKTLIYLGLQDEQRIRGSRAKLSRQNGMAHVSRYRPAIRLHTFRSALPELTRPTGFTRHRLQSRTLPKRERLKPFQTSQSRTRLRHTRLYSKCRSHQLSRYSATTNPGKIAIAFGRDAWTFSEFHRLSRNVGQNLIEAGAEPGDRVALHFLNGPEFGARGRRLFEGRFNCCSTQHSPEGS